MAGNADLGHAKLSGSRRLIPFDNGIPSTGCLFRLMGRQFQTCFVALTGAVAHLRDGKVVALDGKRLRRSDDRRRGQPATPEPILAYRAD